MAPTSLSDLHRLLLERLADEWTTDMACLLRTASRPVTEDAGAAPAPTVPRVHTLSLLRVSEEVHNTQDHATITQRLHQHAAAFGSALDQGAAAVLRELQCAAGSATSDGELLLVLHGLAAAGWKRGGAVDLDPEVVARRSGAALRDLSSTTMARLACQAFPARGVALVLGALGWSPDDVLDLSVNDLASLDDEVPATALVAVRALHRLRLAQGAAGGDRALPPAAGRHCIQRYTVRRWIGLLGPEYGVHTPSAQSRRDQTTAVQRLRRLGIRIRDV